MGKAERKANRQERRTQRRALIAAVTNAIENKTITFKPSEGAEVPFVDVFNQIWPIVEPALKLAMTYTGDKTDATLQDVLNVGELVSEGGNEEQENEFREKFEDIWGKVSFILEIVQKFTNKKIDAIIDQILEIGDWIAGDEHETDDDPTVGDQ